MKFDTRILYRNNIEKSLVCIVGSSNVLISTKNYAYYYTHCSMSIS